MLDPAHRSIAQRAWCLYDWANSAFTTSVVAAILPVYFARMAARSMPAHDATALWGYASALALTVTAVLSPIVGTLADQTRHRKPILFGCVVVGCVGTLALAGCGPTYVGYRGYGGGNGSYAYYNAYEAPRTPVIVYSRYRAYSGAVHGYYYDDYGRRRYY